MYKHKFNIQHFATLNTQTTGASGMSAEMKTYYVKDLLDNAKANLVHDQFGQKRALPKGNGKTIEWRRWSTLPKALTALTEGVTPNGQTTGATALTATIAQYGGYIAESDMLELTAIDNVILEDTKALGVQAGTTIDTLIRNELCGGTNAILAPKVTTSGTTAVTSRAGLDTTAKLTPDLVYQAVRTLKRKNVPKIGDSYVCIIHPDVAYDLMRSQEWIDWHKYAEPENLYNGEIGKLGGVRFVESTEAKIWNNETCPKPDSSKDVYLSVYACLFLGADAYGVVDLEGGALEHIVKQKGSGGTEDPLNQRSTVGWKVAFAAKRLAEERIVRVECCSSISATSTAN